MKTHYHHQIKPLTFISTAMKFIAILGFVTLISACNDSAYHNDDYSAENEQLILNEAIAKCYTRVWLTTHC